MCGSGFVVFEPGGPPTPGPMVPWVFWHALLGKEFQTKTPKRSSLSDKSRKVVPKRGCRGKSAYTRDESSWAKCPRRKVRIAISQIPYEDSQATSTNRNSPNQHSWTEDPERKIPNEIFQCEGSQPNNFDFNCRAKSSTLKFRMGSSRMQFQRKMNPQRKFKNAISEEEEVPKRGFSSDRSHTKTPTTKVSYWRWTDEKYQTKVTKLRVPREKTEAMNFVLNSMW